MGTFKLEIKTDNAAFSENGEGSLAAEVARILRDQVAEDVDGTSGDGLVEGQRNSGRCRDYNGNPVGNWTYRP